MKGHFGVLSDSLRTVSDMAFLTIGQSTPGYTMAILKQHSSYYLLDSHSRNNYGMLSPDGVAVLTEPKGSEDLVAFVMQLANSIGLPDITPFELTPIMFITNYFKDSDDDSFEGFSCSDGEVDCAQYLLCEKSKLLDKITGSFRKSNNWFDVVTTLTMVNTYNDSDTQILKC